MIHLGVSTVKALKDWWVPVCCLSYAQVGLEHSIQMVREQRTCPLLLFSEHSAANRNSIWVHSSACSFATSIKNVQARAVYSTLWKSRCGLGSFLPLQMLLGMHSFKCWYCVVSRLSHFRIVVKYHIVEITAVDIKLAEWWLLLGVTTRINSFSNDCFQVQCH